MGFWSKHFNRRNIIIAAISCSLLLGYFVLSRLDMTDLVGSIVRSQINNRLNGKLSFDDFDFKFKRGHFLVFFDRLLLEDLNNNPVLRTQKMNMDFDLKQLLTLKIKIRGIASDYLQIKAVRDADLRWNLANLLKPSRKLFSFEFGEFDFKDIDLEVIDLMSTNRVNYEGIALKIRPQRYHYDIGIQTQEAETNYFRAFGMWPKSKHRKLLSKESRLKLQIVNLDPLSLSLIGSLLASDPALSNLINGYIAGTTLSLQLDYDNDDSGAKYLRLQSKIKNLEDIETVFLDSELHLSKDLVFDKARLSYDSTVLDLSGSVKDWQDDAAGLALTLDMKDLNLFEMVDRFPELEKYIPNFILEIFNILHGDDYLNGKLYLGSKLDEPELLAQLKINAPKERLEANDNLQIVTATVNEKQDLSFNIKYKGSNLQIKECTIPVDYSRLAVYGDYDLEEDSFDLHFKTDDLPLMKLRPIAASMPILDKYREILARSAVLGYVSLDLQLKRWLDKQRQLQTGFYGSCRFAKLRFKTLDYPLTVHDAHVDMTFNGSSVVVEKLLANIYNPEYGPMQNHVEAKGEFRLDNEDLHLEFAAPKLDAQTLLDSGLSSLASDTLKLDSAKGSFKDVLLILDNNANQLSFDLDLDIDSVDLLAGKQSVTDINGGFAYKQERFEFDDLNFSMGENSRLMFDGSIAQDLKKAKLNIKADDVSFPMLMTLVNGSQFGIDAFGGKFDANLTLLGEDLGGEFDFDKLDFKYDNLDKYPIVDLNGHLVLSKDLDFSHVNARYGGTVVQDLNCRVENYRSQDLDRTIDLGAKLDFNSDDFYYLLPESAQKFLKVSGNFPLKLYIKGNRLKQAINVNAELDKANYFNFGDWFVLKPEASRVKVISHMIITPQLIRSDNSKLVFIKGTGSDQIKTKVRSSFQVEDYRSGDDLSYFLSFKTKSTDAPHHMGLLEPHIVPLAPLNLKVGLGDLGCDTFGNLTDRQTICEFNFDEAVAQKYGIGDLNARKINVDLLSIARKPLEVQVMLQGGDWNTIPYRRAHTDLTANGDFIYLRDTKAKVADGVVRAEIDYNVKTFESKFKLEGRDLPAHDLAQGIWGFGSEVPEGLVSGVFTGNTQGFLPEPMFNNLVGTANLILKRGKLSQLVLMQKVLTAVNTLDNFDLNNIFQTLVTFKGGTFDHVISSIDYDHGVMSSEKLLLKADQIELNLNGYFDYNQDQLWVKGQGLIPKKSRSILQGLGIGKINLGNLLSLDDLSESGSKEKRFFDFLMIGPISDPDKSVESLKSNFKWQ